MTRNPPPGGGRRIDAVRERSRTYNPRVDRWVKRDTEAGRLIGRPSAPERSQLELDGIERSRANDRIAVVLLDRLETPSFEDQHFERPTQRIDEPSVRHTLARVDA